MQVTPSGRARAPPFGTAAATAPAAINRINCFTGREVIIASPIQDAFLQARHERESLGFRFPFRFLSLLLERLERPVPGFDGLQIISIGAIGSRILGERSALLEGFLAQLESGFIRESRAADPLVHGG